MTSSQHSQTRENAWLKPKHVSGYGRENAPQLVSKEYNLNRILGELSYMGAPH